MPIHQNRADLAQELIGTYHAIPQAKREAASARADAKSAAAEGYPPEVIQAYQVIAEQTIGEMERMYEDLRAKWAAGN